MYYTHNLQQLRLFPGILRDSEKFLKLYNYRSGIERRISHLKVALHAGDRMTQSIRSLKSDFCLAGWHRRSVDNLVGQDAPRPD